MKHINFEAIRLQEELAGARQCVVCVTTLAILNLLAALLCLLGELTLFLAFVWIIGSISLALAAIGFAMLPKWRARKLEREMWESDNGSYVSAPDYASDHVEPQC